MEPYTLQFPFSLEPYRVTDPRVRTYIRTGTVKVELKRMWLKLCWWLANNAKSHFSIRPGGKPYIERFYLGNWFGIGVFLHQYLDQDGDRQLHNHPWRWALGIPLMGGYKEERLVHICPHQGVKFDLRNIWRFRPNYIRGFDFHRIASVKPGTWTLFIHGKRVGGWGFLLVEERVPSHPEEQEQRIWFEQNEEGILKYTREKLERG